MGVDNIRVGWITYTYPRSLPHEEAKGNMSAVIRMRYFNIADWINRNSDGIHNEVYDPEQRYEMVVFLKMMDARCQAEVNKIHDYGGKVIFDANVNYYDIWGDYFIPQTKPTEEQRQQAIWMTTHADYVIADSTYLAGLAMRYNQRVAWIPDNVDLSHYKGGKLHKHESRPVLAWSGMCSKANHLLLIKDVLASLPPTELHLISDQEPECLSELQSVIKCSYRRFNPKTYPELLLESDIVISPKIMVNGYELGHTEYKITTGMAQGLPAVASPQQSYLEAIGHNSGGFIACNLDQWSDALTCLIQDCNLRTEIGERAQQTVAEQYATPVIARKYQHLLQILHRY